MQRSHHQTLKKKLQACGLKNQRLSQNVSFQSRFLFESVADDTQWYIPISYTISTDPNPFESLTPREWLTPGGGDLVLPNVLQSSDNWIIVNNQASGRYLSLSLSIFQFVWMLL